MSDRHLMNFLDDVLSRAVTDQPSAEVQEVINFIRDRFQKEYKPEFTVEQIVVSVLENYRGIEIHEACKDCDGFGIKVYGSTATYRGGIGGQMMTNDVCNKCWGSGRDKHPWPARK